MSTFVGRDHDVQELVARLGDSRLVTVTGTGGVGKTRVATEAAERMAQAFPGGIWTLALAQTEGVGDAVATVMPGAGDPAELVAALAESTALVILDSCEHVVGEVGGFVAELLRRCPGVRVLATSRQRLGLPGETVFVLAPLAVRSEAAVGAEPSEAARFFLDRARQVISVSSGELPIVEEICARLEGIPLALELAAARLTMLSLRGLRHRLAQPLSLLTDGRLSEDPRHRTLTASIAWSYELCSSEEKRVWRALSIISVPLAAGALEYIVSQVLPDAEHPLDVADGLLRKSVLTRYDDVQPWFSLLVPLRDFGRERLRELDEVEQAERLRLESCRHLAAVIDEEWLSDRQRSIHAQLIRALPDVRPAIDYALSIEGGARIVFEIVRALWRPLVEGQGMVGEVSTWLDRALELVSAHDFQSVSALGLQAYLHGVLHGVETARPMFARMREQAASIGEERLIVYADAGPALLDRPSPAGISLLERALEVDLESVGLLTRVGINVSLIVMHDQIGEQEVADRLIDDWIRSSEASDELFEQRAVLSGCAATALQRGDAERALRLARRSLQLSDQYEPSLNVIMCIQVIAGAYALQGASARAATLLGVAGHVGDLLGPQPQSLFQVGLDVAAIERSVREVLGDDLFHECYLTGRGLPPAEARAVVLDEKRAASGAKGDGGLTRRESEIHALVVSGLTNAEIAQRLTISVRTVEWHVENILMKLGAKSRTQIVAAAAESVGGRTD